MAWLYESYLWALLAVPLVIALFFWAAWQRESLSRRFGDPDLLSKLTNGLSARRRRWKAAMCVLAVLLLAVALAGPRYGTQTREVALTGVDMIVALDVSRSMLAEDVAPNRLRRARQEIHNMLDEIGGGRVGLVLFAGDAFLQCPLTHDFNALRMFLDISEPDLMPVQGTDFGIAIQTAMNAFKVEGTDEKTSGDRTQVLLIVSDGEDNASNSRAALREARQDGIIVLTAGVGTVEGSRIPLRENSGRVHYVTDRNGAEVVSRLDPGTLREFSSADSFIPIGQGQGLRDVPAALAQLQQTEYAVELFEEYREQYQLPLLLAVLLLVIERVIHEQRYTGKRKLQAA